MTRLLGAWALSVAMLASGCGTDDRNLSTGAADGSSADVSVGASDARGETAPDGQGTEVPDASDASSRETSAGPDGSGADGEAGADAEPTCGDCPGPIAGDGMPYCDRGTCKIRCATGLTLCGTNVCADLQNDGANCKACGSKCDPGFVCKAGTCGMNCASGLTACDGSCVNLQSNLDHCNDCTKKCDRPAANGTAKCELGVCSVQCNTGLLYCSKTCVDPKSDKTNCGMCGNPCADSCKQGICCLASETNCSGVCVNTNSSLQHCGGCDRPCGGVCTGGVCCTGGTSNCSGTCVNLQNDKANCGICGKPCAAGEKCQGGGCIKDCGALTLCPDNSCYNLATDPTHCLSCSTNCGGVPNGMATCTASGCDVACGANLKCNRACCPPPPTYQVATCVGNQCSNACASGVTPLSCANPVAGVPACGAWRFESNTNEGWTADLSVTTNPSNAATGQVYMSAPPGAGGGTHSLAVNVATSASKTLVRVKGKVCPGGNKLNVSNLIFKVDIWFSGSPDGGLAGPGYVYTYDGGTFVSMSGDQNLLPRQWQTWSVPGTFGTMTDIEINIGFSTSTPWTGTVYFDNLRFEP